MQKGFFIIRVSLSACLLLAVSFAFPTQIYAQAHSSPYWLMRLGTLEFDQDKAIFRWKDGTESYNFSFSPNQMSATQNKIPGLTEIGIETTSGKIFLYDGKSKNDFLLKLLSTNPDIVVKGIVFGGADLERVEIDISGKTLVMRLDIDLGVPGKLERRTFWKKIEKGEIENSAGGKLNNETSK